MTISRAGADDWSAFRAIRLRSLAEAPQAFGSTLVREQPFSEATWRERVAGMVFLARHGDRVVGTASGYVDPEREPGTVQLVAMYVEPDVRGRGLAGRLIDAVAAAAVELGGRRLVLYVTDVNAVADRSYRRYGFTPTGRTVPLPHAPEITEVELGLELPAAPRAGTG